MITTGDASAQGSAAAGGLGSLCIHLLLDVLLNRRTSNKALARYIAIQGHRPAVSAEYLRYYPQCISFLPLTHLSTNLVLHQVDSYLVVLLLSSDLFLR